MNGQAPPDITVLSVAQIGRQWRRSQVKSGGINIEKIEGVGCGRGCALPSWGSGGLPQKKINFALKIMQS